MKNKKIKEKIDWFFDWIVNFYIYWAIAWLISYMISTLIWSFLKFIEKFSSFSQSYKEISPEIIQHWLLHNIAFTIVLVKAYIILREYAEKKHINIKYTLEIAIIAAIIEIVFNYNSYKFEMIIFFWFLAWIMSIIYLYFYEKLEKIEENYIKQYK